MRFNQGLHYLQTSLTSASLACTSYLIHDVQILGNAMCREGYFLFLKKKESGQANFSTGQVICFFTCPVGKWKCFLFVSPWGYSFAIFSSIFQTLLNSNLIDAVLHLKYFCFPKFSPKSRCRLYANAGCTPLSTVFCKHGSPGYY